MSADTRNRGLALALTALLAVVTPALAENHYDRGNVHGNQMLLRALPQDAAQIAAQHGLEIAGSHHGEDGYVALLEAPSSLTAEQIEDLLQGDPRVGDLSRARVAALPETGTVTLAQTDVATDLSRAGDFTTACLAQGFGGLLWSGYADQDAVRQISLHEAHLAGGCGAAVVAILDTGVDPDHPLLRGALVPGFDFILEQPGTPSEWTGLEQSVSAILEQSVSAILEQSVSAILEGEGEVLALASLGPVLAQSVSAILEEDAPPPFFGHGTMVAGLVRLAAPTAQIMPLRVFESSGSAHVFDVVRAIYYAVDHGADVISMSFSIDESSPELRQAVRYANRHGVACVAAAGNDGEQAMVVYPAAYAKTLGVAALDGEALSPFSNSGGHLVSVAAPGTGVISAYPGGLYGAGWGTSFSAPLVSGTLALLRHLHPEATSSAVTAMRKALRQGSSNLPGQCGFGALDVLGAVLEAQ